MIYYSRSSGGNIVAGKVALKGFVISSDAGGATDIEIYDDLLATANPKFKINARDGECVPVMLPHPERFDEGISVVFSGTGSWSVIWQ